MPKIRKNYGAVRAESIRTYGRTDGRTDESKSIVPPKFFGSVQKTKIEAQDITQFQDLSGAKTKLQSIF